MKKESRQRIRSTDVTDVRKKEEGRRKKKKVFPMPNAQCPMPNY
ncbi:hypothetical protein [Microcoleus sp. Pol12B5]